MGEDEAVDSTEPVSDSKEAPNLIAEDTIESRGVGLSTIIIALIVLVGIAFLAFMKMRK